MVVPVSFRCREACLTPADLKVFSTLLVENFTTARYFADPGLHGLDGQEPPEVVIAFRLHDLRDYEVYMTFDEDWLPQWGRAGHYGDWSLSYPRLPHVRFLVGRVRPADQRYPERIDSLDIQCSCRPHRKEDFTMARRLFHLLGKVATNRNQVYVSYPGYEVITVFEKGGQGSVWLGHDAIRWAREDPRRLLTMHPSGRGGMRPMDD
ncbi:MAG TPA: hypothetical protein VK196_02840 [Magnetospirillum sp.]|nr:hypothetical protein [Magnetospirillum sp.]